MNLGQRRRRAKVENIVKACQKQGLSSFDLRDLVHKTITNGVHPDDPRHEDMWRRADRISRAGLMAQAYFLLEVMSEKRLTAWVEKSGNALDAFVKGFSSTPEAREADIGRNNIDLDGSVVID